MPDSPIELLLAAIDRLDLDGVMTLMTLDCRLLTVDGRRAEGAPAVRELLGEFIAELRSTSHRITGHWHQHDVWIAEVEASYELQDWLRLERLPRAFIVRSRPEGIALVHAYGAHEAPLSEHDAGPRGLVIGGRWVPPL